MLLLLEKVGELAKAIRKNATNMSIDNSKINHYDTIESEVADVFIVLIYFLNITLKLGNVLSSTLISIKYNLSTEYSFFIASK